MSHHVVTIHVTCYWAQEDQLYIFPPDQREGRSFKVIFSVQLTKSFLCVTDKTIPLAVLFFCQAYAMDILCGGSFEPQKYAL